MKCPRPPEPSAMLELCYLLTLAFIMRFWHLNFSGSTFTELIRDRFMDTEPEALKTYVRLKESDTGLRTYWPVAGSIVPPSVAQPTV